MWGQLRLRSEVELRTLFHPQSQLWMVTGRLARMSRLKG